MKSFLLFLCLAAAEKLDRTYLPPPGSKYSGGAPGDIQAPFEIPKETYSTTSRPEIYNNGALAPEDTRIEVGINRGVPSRPGISGDIVTPGQTSDYYQNTYKVPTTTTSYAFTTTTTHPPGEEYESTTGPINPATGLPVTNFDYATSAPGFINPEVYNTRNQPGTFQQNLQPGRVISNGPSQYPATTTIAPGSQFVNQNQPGFIQGGTQNQRPGFAPDLVQRPITTPGEAPFQYQGNRYPVNVPGSGIQNTLVPSTFTPGTVVPSTFAPTTFAPGTTPSSIQYGGNLDQNVFSNQNAPSSQGSNAPSVPSISTQGSYYPGQNVPQYNITPGQQLPQGSFQQGPNLPGQVYYDTKGGVIPQFPTSSDEFGRPIQNIYQPITTTLPTSFIPNLGQFPSSTLGSQPSATTVYPSGSIPTTSAPGFQSQEIQTTLIPRPVRPQAEADRNAVILNYENVLTPEGDFAYSFDTSNGIHVDESGTAVDGVKAKGSYSYIGDDGKLYSVVYTADENGFQPRGDHLPTAPPIPEAIQKVIDQIKKDQGEGISDDGTYNEDKYGHMKYQGGRYRPQRPQRIHSDEVSGNEDGQYNQSDRRQQNRPQSGNVGPVTSNQHYEDIEQDVNNGAGTTTYDQRRPIGKKPYQRPINRNPETYNEQYNPNFSSGEGSGDGQNNENVSLMPNSDRGQFEGQFSVRPLDEYTESDNDNRLLEQGSRLDGSHPVLENQANYGLDDSRRRPAIQRPSGIVNQSSEDLRQEHGDGRRPSDKPGNLGDGETNIYDNKKLSSAISGRRPGQFQSDDGVSFVPSSSHGTFGNRIRPVTSTAQPFDQTEIYNYQDSNIPGGINKYLPGKGYTGQPASSSTTISPILNQYTGSPVEDNTQQRIDNRPGQNYYPTTSRPSSRVPGSNSDVTGSKSYDSTASRLHVTGRPFTDGPSSSNQYSSSRGRPQSSTTPVPQQGSQYYDNRVIEPADNQAQNVRRPGPDRRPSVTPIKEEGYQYLPPQRKFEPDSRQPGGSQVISSNRKPSQDRIYEKQGEVPKPFTTPDATRYEDVIEDDYDHAQDNNQHRKPQYGEVQPSQLPTSTQKTYETYNKENIPENYDEVCSRRPCLTRQDGNYGSRIDTTRIPGDKFTTIGSTQRPSYQQIQTTRPQQYRPTGSVYESTQGVPTGSVQPQGGNRYFRPNEDKITYGTSTPVPSQSTRFEVTRPSQLNTDRYPGVSDQTPSIQGFFTQTTKAPVTSGRFDFRPTQTIYDQTPVNGVDSALGTTFRPEKPSGRPGYSQNQLPSTTNRPAYFPNQSVTEKQIPVDNFGRPLPESQQPNQGEDRPGSGRPSYSQNLPSTTFRPAYYPAQTVTEKQMAVDNFGRPLPQSQQPIQGDYRPGSSLTPGNVSPSSQDSRRPIPGFKPVVDKYGRPTGPAGNVPSFAGPEGSSTTEKIIGEDFSGPKQTQRFDPERGYYY